MQFRFILLVAVTTLLAGSNVVSASIDVDMAVSEAKATELFRSTDAVSIHGKAGRFLRTSKFADADSDDQNDELNDEERGLPGTLSEKAASTAAKLTRSKSVSSEKAVLQKLTRSMSLPGKSLELEQVVAKVKKGVKASLARDFDIMNKQKKDPDDMFRFFNLNHKFARATKADKYSLRQATEGNDELFAQYKLWYKYTEYYKEKHPEWVSSLVTAV